MESLVELQRGGWTEDARFPRERRWASSRFGPTSVHHARHRACLHFNSGCWYCFNSFLFCLVSEKIIEKPHSPICWEWMKRTVRRRGENFDDPWSQSVGKKFSKLFWSWMFGTFVCKARKWAFLVLYFIKLEMMNVEFRLNIKVCLKWAALICSRSDQ